LPHRDDYNLEHDRKATRDLIEKLYPSIDTGDYHEFKKPDEGIKFLEKNKKLYVLKGFNTEADTIVPDSNDLDDNHEILIDALEDDDQGYYEKNGFILEEKIPDVIEFTPEAIGFDGELRCVSINVEHKRFGSRSGPQVGCNSNIVVWLEEYEKVFDTFLEPLASRMLRKNEMTVWDLSVLYSPSRKKYYAGELCPNRMGFDAVYAQCATFGSASDWLAHVMGEDKEYFDIGVSLRVFNVEKTQAIFIGDPANENVWCYDIHKEENKLQSVGAGRDAYVLTAASDDMDEAIDELYELEHGVEFDPGFNLEKHDWYDKEWPINVLHRIDFLKKLGMLKGGEYAKKETIKAGQGAGG
jgi:hypothetical protein